jgi:hypothetical protein
VHEHLYENFFFGFQHVMNIITNGSGAHPASYPVGTGALSVGVKRLAREANHSPPTRSEVKECVKLYLHSPNMSSWLGS